jgi:hypothetical protein
VLNILRKYELTDLKHKFMALYLLNVTDILFTLILLNSGAFIEANVVMRSIVENEFVSILLKIILPFLLLYILFKRIKSASSRQLKISNVFISGAVVIYSLINLSHLIWISLYFFIY